MATDYNGVRVIKQREKMASHYGFTDQELDFIINYDIKYRLGRDAGEECLND